MKSKYTNTNTEKLLVKALEDEAKAYLKYMTFASVAKKEGLNTISIILESIAKQELEHGKLWLNELGLCGDTIFNLKSSALLEAKENEILYPEYSKMALEEGFTELAKKFELAGEVEGNHKRIFESLESKLSRDKLYKSDFEKAWVCMNCGHIVIAEEAPVKCPLCDHPKGYFKES